MRASSVRNWAPALGLASHFIFHLFQATVIFAIIGGNPILGSSYLVGHLAGYAWSPFLFRSNVIAALACVASISCVLALIYSHPSSPLGMMSICYLSFFVSRAHGMLSWIFSLRGFSMKYLQSHDLFGVAGFIFGIWLGAGESLQIKEVIAHFLMAAIILATALRVSTQKSEINSLPQASVILNFVPPKWRMTAIFLFLTFFAALVPIFLNAGRVLANHYDPHYFFTFVALYFYLSCKSAIVAFSKIAWGLIFSVAGAVCGVFLLEGSYQAVSAIFLSIFMPLAIEAINRLWIAWGVLFVDRAGFILEGTLATTKVLTALLVFRLSGYL